MISRNDFYKFLTNYLELYNGDFGNYTSVNPCNEKHEAFHRYNSFITENSINVVKPNKNTDTNYMLLTNYKNWESTEFWLRNNPEYEIKVESTDLSPVDSSIVDKAIELWIEKIKYEYYNFADYTDVVTINDVSMTIYEIMEAIDTYAEPDRISKFRIDDIYVTATYGKSAPVFKICQRYSEDKINEIENLYNDIYPYWFDQTTYVPTEFVDGFVSFDDFIHSEQKLTRENVKWLITCKVPDFNSVEDRLNFSINICKTLISIDDHFITLLMIRHLTQNKMNTDVPDFKIVAHKSGEILREIRSIG